MRRSVVLGLLFAVLVWAANVRLYLKDGNYHIVREYQVIDDRVRYYSVERGDWEEIPLALVDLKRTESEAVERQAEIAETRRNLPRRTPPNARSKRRPRASRRSPAPTGWMATRPGR